MSLTTPNLLSQPTFNALTGTPFGNSIPFRFSIAGGPEPEGSKLYVQDISSSGDNYVYQGTSKLYPWYKGDGIYEHSMPINSLSNEKQYRAFLTTYNDDGTSSVSNTIVFWAISTPVVLGANYIQGLSYSSYNFIFNYSPGIGRKELLKSYNCDFIIAVGGGSTIDVAKCIRCFTPMDLSTNCLQQGYVPFNVPLLVMPTTAGTGSESTHFAVLYSQGQKKSVSHASLLPNYVILDHGNLKELPLYQKKAAFFDALSQAIESWWSKNATVESIEYSKKAIELLKPNLAAYLQGNDISASNVMQGANLAGKAINITTTTAPHAMSYKLTSLYGIAHGHSVALCLPRVWKIMCEQSWDYDLHNVLEDIAKALGAHSSLEAIQWWDDILISLKMETPDISVQDIEILTESVNLERLANNPMPLNKEEIYGLYKQIARNNL